MSVVSDAVEWLNDPLNWMGTHGVLALTREHLTISVAAVLLAAVIALPLGVWLGPHFLLFLNSCQLLF